VRVCSCVLASDVERIRYYRASAYRPVCVCIGAAFDGSPSCGRQGMAALAAADDCSGP